MKRRLATIAAITAALAAGATAATAVPGGNNTASRWGCVGVQLVDQGVCLSNPLPERLPLPASPGAPS